MSVDPVEHHVDQHSGVSTTGHEWDGIRELNTPLPRWWLRTFYITIVWAIAYCIAYPALPLIGGFTHGLLGWNSRTAVEQDLSDLRNLRAGMNAKILAAPLAEIEKNPDLLSFARAQGAAAFATNCSPCHGAGAQGSRGYPNLNADRWLWGGTLDDIHTTIEHGVRWDADKQTRMSLMPSFGRDGLLKPDDISKVADYVRSLSGLETPKDADLAAGQKIFATNCAVCHGPEGKGNQKFGAPNLTSKIWLYASDKNSIMQRVFLGGGGVMPAWSGKLSEETIKSLTVFVHTLGGGQ